jgi:sarcosine oxidase
MIDNVPDERRCIVIGAGLLGLSAAWALTGRGWRVLVLESAGAPGHERSGSKGDARIFRLGYPEPHYVAMAVLARMLWHDLERASGRQLVQITGQVTIGDDAALDAIAGALAAAGAPVEHLSAAALSRRFPGIAAAGPALVEPDSGVLAADECLRALREAGGFELRTGTPVTSVHDRSPDSVTVETAVGTALEADVVVACAGPATLGLVGTGAAVAAKPSLPQVAYFKARRSGGAPLPVFIEWGDDMTYGLPVPGRGPHAGTYKVSHHTPGPVLGNYEPADPAAFAADDAALLARLIGAVERLVPSLDPSPVASERCLYDNAVDADFILDRVGRIVVGCGTSGHAFKFGPLLGELLADLVEGSEPQIDLSPFRLTRDPAAAHGTTPDGR